MRTKRKVVAHGPRPAGLTSPEAFNELLKGGDQYHLSSCNVAPYNLELLKIDINEDANAKCSMKGKAEGDAEANVIYKNVWMDSHISSYGWGDWSHACAAGPASGVGCSSDPQCWCQNVTFAEFNSSGPGGNPAHRVKWSVQLTAEEASQVTPASVLHGWVPKLPE